MFYNQFALRYISVYPCTYREHESLLTQGFVFYRFIPVHTGNIIFDEFSACSVPVYPCTYREHSGEIEQDADITGLSLYIQGTYQTPPVLFVRLRFIPVHTGNILNHLINVTLDAVYPCTYREHSLMVMDI